MALILPYSVHRIAPVGVVATGDGGSAGSAAGSSGRAGGRQSRGKPLLPAPPYHLFFLNTFPSAWVLVVETNNF